MRSPSTAVPLLVQRKTKPISKPPPPENHVAMMERKRCEKHEIVTKNYFKAKMKYLRFQKEIKKITQASVRAAAGPTWYQELSNKQMNILDGFDVYLKDDHDLGTATNTRRALKSLGVTMFIPKFVAMDALVTSELNPVKFLTVIKDYVIQKTRVTGDQINIGKKKFYSTEERILMSSIVHMQFPLLIKKLDYCLQDPVPDKKLEYIKLSKAKQKPIKYLSPYLEPLPKTEIPWAKMKEIKRHNVNVKKQRIRENAKAKKKQELNEMALDFENKILYKMKINFPDQPLEKMSYDPPLTEKLKLKEDSQRSTENVSSFVSVGKADRRTSADRIDEHVADMCGSDDADEPSVTDEEFAGRTSMECESAGTSSRPSAARTFGRGRSPKSKSASKSVSFGDGRPRESVADDLGTRPYGWLFDEWPPTSAYSWCAQSSSADEDDAGETPAVTDADGGSGDESTDDDDDDAAAAGSDHVCGNDTINGSYGSNNLDVYFNSFENDNGWLENNDELRATIRILRGGTGGRCSRERLSTSSGTDVTVVHDGEPNADAYPPRRNIPSAPTTEPSDDVCEDDEPSDDVCEDDEPSEDVCEDDEPSAAVPNDEPSAAVPTDEPSAAVLTDEPSAAVLNDEPSGQRARDAAFNEDGTFNLDIVLAEFRKLPPWKQLKAVLQFLAILGDPIAGFPDLIDVGKLRRWYEIRLKIDRKVKSKANTMMAKSVATWNRMTRSELLDVPVPKSPVQVQNKDGSYVNWDQINDVKFKIKNTEAKYITRLKHTAIDNARNTYPIMQDRLLNSRLKANFKHIFYDYFPAKEDDCLFGKTSPAAKKFNMKGKRANR